MQVWHARLREDCEHLLMRSEDPIPGTNAKPMIGLLNTNIMHCRTVHSQLRACVQLPTPPLQFRCVVVEHRPAYLSQSSTSCAWSGMGMEMAMGWQFSAEQGSGCLDVKESMCTAHEPLSAILAWERTCMSSHQCKAFAYTTHLFCSLPSCTSLIREMSLILI